MRLQILDLAREDLIEGFHFYEDKEKGLGDYMDSAASSEHLTPPRLIRRIAEFFVARLDRIL